MQKKFLIPAIITFIAITLSGCANINLIDLKSSQSDSNTDQGSKSIIEDFGVEDIDTGEKGDTAACQYLVLQLVSVSNKERDTNNPNQSLIDLLNDMEDAASIAFTKANTTEFTSILNSFKYSVSEFSEYIKSDVNNKDITNNDEYLKISESMMTSVEPLNTFCGSTL